MLKSTSVSIKSIINQTNDVCLFISSVTAQNNEIVRPFYHQMSRMYFIDIH